MRITGVSVPRETGEPKGVEGVLARDAALAAPTQRRERRGDVVVKGLPPGEPAQESQKNRRTAYLA